MMSGEGIVVDTIVHGAIERIEKARRPRPTDWNSNMPSLMSAMLSVFSVRMVSRLCRCCRLKGSVEARTVLDASGVSTSRGSH